MRSPDASPHANDAAPAVQARVAERDIAWVRFAIIAFNITVYATLMPHPPARHGLAIAVSIVAALYAVLVVAFRPYERFPVLRTSAYTVVTDSALIALWLYATGGIDSPFYPLWLLSIVAVVFRFRPLVVAVAAGTYLLADAAMLAVSGDLPAPLPVAVRSMYIAIVGALGILLGMRWTTAVSAREEAVAEVARQDQQLRETERFRLLANASLEGLLVHRDGRIIEANAAAGDLFGLPAQDVIGRHAMDFIDPESLDDLRERLANPQEAPYQLWVRRSDGERRRVTVQARPMEFQGGPARVTALRDITDEYEAHQALLKSAMQDAEIERLQALDHFKTRFINTAAHELNTPMTPIKLQLHMLKEDLEARMDEPPRSLMVLERNMDRLARLVADLLDVARMESGKLRVRQRTVDLVPICDEVHQAFAAAAARQGVNLEPAVPERLVCAADPERVLQILTNLISNALKFTPEGGSITLHGREARDGIRIEVTDTGSGMDEAQQERLFQPFSQAHQDPDIPGTGLGLHICRNLIEAMGGRIGCQSSRGEGTTFWFEIPRTAVVEAPDEAAGPQGRPLVPFAREQLVPEPLASSPPAARQTQQDLPEGQAWSAPAPGQQAARGLPPAGPAGAPPERPPPEQASDLSGPAGAPEAAGRRERRADRD